MANVNNNTANHELPEMRQPLGILREVALKIALSYEGKEEVPRGSNGGKFVIDCLKTVGLTTPNSWCMAFVYRCLNEAAAKLGVKNQSPKTAGVLDCWAKTIGERKILKSDARPTNILPGYQFIYDHGHGLGHTGLVVEMHADGTFTTIEGNTNNDHSRNGYGVFKLKRSLKDATLKGFIMLT